MGCLMLVARVLFPQQNIQQTTTYGATWTIGKQGGGRTDGSLLARKQYITIYPYIPTSTSFTDQADKLYQT